MFRTFFDWLSAVDEINLTEYLSPAIDAQAVRWEKKPFPHLVIQNLFRPLYAKELRNSVENLIQKRGVSETFSREHFSRMRSYDAYNFTPLPSLENALRVFYSREWYEFFKKISKIELDENVLTSIHHHKIGSKDGFIHTDYAKYAFRSMPFPNQLNHWRGNSIYQEHDDPNFRTQEGVTWTRRALALLYYLDDGTWKIGDGGETALYDNSLASTPFLKVPPRDNTLLVFQISPRSFHGFIENKTRPRNSIIQWMHQPIETMDKRLGIA